MAGSSSHHMYRPYLIDVTHYVIASFSGYFLFISVI